MIKEPSSKLVEPFEILSLLTNEYVLDKAMSSIDFRRIHRKKNEKKNEKCIYSALGMSDFHSSFGAK